MYIYIYIHTYYPYICIYTHYDMCIYIYIPYIYTQYQPATQNTSQNTSTRRAARPDTDETPTRSGLAQH